MKLVNKLKNNRMILLLSFAIPFLIMLVIFIMKEIFPFGDRSFLCSDMYHQYMPFFAEFMRKIKAGEGLAYSYNVGIGSNFLALYVYYLASPLHWLAFLVPEGFLMEFMSYLAMVKIGLCGLTSCIYLQKHFKEDKDLGVLLFSCFYALSGFMAAYNWNIMWLDCVVLLPLIMLGLERLVKEGRCTLYCVTLALSIFTNFYISIMICIFLVLYFMVLFVTEKMSWKTIGRFAFFSMLAGGMAAILLIPEVLAILETDFGDMNFPDTVTSYFPILDVLARHCMCIGTHRGLDHWPNIYCGAAAFMLLPMYAMNDKISAKKRLIYLGLAGFMLIGFSTNLLDFIWHGLNYPDSLPGRQSFIYIMLVIIMCYGAYRKVREVEPKTIVQAYLIAVGFLLFVEKFVEHSDFEMGVEWLNLGFVTAYAALLYLHRVKTDQAVRAVIAVIAFVVVIAEAGINTYNTSVWTVSRSDYLGELPDYESLYELAQEREAEENGSRTFFRIEKFARRTKNDGTLVGYPTGSVFSSTLNSYVMDLYKRLGMRHSKVFYGYDGATFLTSALLNVEYMYGEIGMDEGPLYTYVEESGKISLYEVNESLPLGYVAPLGFDLPKSGSGLSLQNQIVRKLGVPGNLFTKKTAKSSNDNIYFTVPEDGYYYGILTTSGTSKVKVVTEERTRDLNDLKSGSILHMGYLTEGTEVVLKNGDEEDKTPQVKADVYLMNEEVLKETLTLLRENHLTDVVYDSKNVSGKLSLDEPGRLILSIPYEKGWTVKLNGMEVIPELFGGTFMALDLDSGEYEIQMSYVPHGRNAGIAITIVSLGVFTLVLLFAGRKKRKAKLAAQEKAEIEAEIIEKLLNEESESAASEKTESV